MSEKTIDISKDYSAYPAGRTVSDGPYSGENFRDTILVPALKTFDRITIKIDGVSGYGSSFLEESFGGLVRVQKISKDEIKKKIKISFQDQAFKMYESMIWDYIDQAK